MPSGGARARAFHCVALSCVPVCCGLHFLGFAMSHAIAERQSHAEQLPRPRTKPNGTNVSCNCSYCRCRFSEAAFPQRFSSRPQRSQSKLINIPSYQPSHKSAMYVHAHLPRRTSHRDLPGSAIECGVVLEQRCIDLRLWHHTQCGHGR